MNTDELETSILELICNLQLGKSNNVFEAKRLLAIDPSLSANFDKDHLHSLFSNFNYETEGIVSMASFNVRRLKELLG